jgi:SUF system FeS cluster assembly, SufBD
MIGLSVADVASSTGLKAQALERAHKLGIPTTAWEDFRYIRGPIMPTDAVTGPVPPDADLPEFPGFYVRLWQGVQVDDPVLPDGTRFERITDQTVDALSDSLATETDPTACLGLAYSPTRWALTISKNCSAPITLAQHHLGVGGTAVIITVSANAHATLIIRHDVRPAAWALARMHVALGRGAQLTVHEIINADNAQLFSTTSVTVARDAQFTATNWCTGGQLVRLAQRVTLTDMGAHADIAAGAHLRGKAQLHHHIRVAHACGNTTSTQQFRVLLDDESVRSFDGLVHMPKGVEGANAEQQDRNVVLSAKARVDVRPQLDIHTDDVKAAHGAAIGQMDRDQLLYLRMRGLNNDAAAQLLTTAFLNEITQRLPMELRP